MPRIAYIHGFAGSPDVWKGIGEGVHVALPGHGRPVLPTWEANIDGVADSMKMGSDPISQIDVVVGYSLGARVALALVATNHVPRAILISVNPGLEDDAREPRRVGDAGWATMLRERGIEVFVDAWEAQPLFATQSRVDPKRLAARRAKRLLLDAEELAKSLEVMGLAEMPDYRSAIDDRVALIAGADDAKYLAIAESFDVKREVIASAGHDPLLEQPAALRAALDRLVAG